MSKICYVFAAISFGCHLLCRFYHFSLCVISEGTEKEKGKSPQPLWGPPQLCACNALNKQHAFQHDMYGGHLQTCQVKSAASQVHDWVVHRLGDLLGSVGHRVKIHKITPVTDKERDDLEIKDYVV